MRKIVLFVILMSLALWGCGEKETDYAALLTGTWVNTLVNGEKILSDAAFVCEFKSNQAELYASGFQLDQDNKTWMENDNYSYSLEENKIIIDGTDVLNKAYHMEFEILSLNQNFLTYSIQSFSIDNVEYPDSNIYTCKRVSADYSGLFTGIWYGKCTTPGTTDTGYHYWEYFEDGRFNYYYQNNGLWIKKSDNEGRYFLYGNLFISNYTNDLLSGGTGKAFECWSFDISQNKMIWIGLRADHQVITYEMEKVADPPVNND